MVLLEDQLHSNTTLHQMKRHEAHYKIPTLIKLLNSQLPSVFPRTWNVNLLITLQCYQKSHKSILTLSLYHYASRQEAINILYAWNEITCERDVAFIFMPCNVWTVIIINNDSIYSIVSGIIVEISWLESECRVLIVLYQVLLMWCFDLGIVIIPYLNR